MNPTAAAFRLDDRVALITGGGQGIGEATAVAFADAGAHVALIARTESDLDNVAAQVRSRGREAIVIPGDVNDLEFLATSVSTIAERLGRLDVLVNNAGGSDVSAIHEDDRDPTRIVVPLQCLVRVRAQPPCPAAPARGRGRVDHQHQLGRGPDGDTRFVGTQPHEGCGVTAHSPHGRRAVTPRARQRRPAGAIETAALRNYVSAEIREQMAAKTPMRRNGTPMDIALAVLFLASPASAWTTGQLFSVDGLAPENLVPREMPDL